MNAKPAQIQDAETWNQLVRSLPGGHLLQSWQWGQLKEKYGWKAERLAWFQSSESPLAAAQVLQRTLPIPGLANRLSVLYCPKGPALDWTNAELRQRVLSDLKSIASQRGAILIKIDPNLPLGFGFPGDPQSTELALGGQAFEEFSDQGWRVSRQQIQFANTMTLDLNNTEDSLLAAMKQKTRYNIRLASRRGVMVRRGGIEDLDTMYRMYAETSLRDGFAIRKSAYYDDVWRSFIQAGLAQPFLAEVDQETVAGLIAYRFGNTAWYIYGMSRSAHREKMPNHLLQWEAIRWAKSVGCTTYDFWGAPDRSDEKDSMWGVYRFKLGFGARLVRTPGALDFTTRPALYWMYSVALPSLLAVLRLRGRAQTRQSLN
jgi:lipid II:glycine glycyltransferase (peptidoglycan interpeptide bridge formation enzyme)